MPDDPRATVKFPKVAPLSPASGEPSPVAPSARPPVEPSRPAPSPGSNPPEWYEDPPTIRTQVAVPALVAPPTEGRASLTVLAGLNAGQVFTLDRDETIVGRGRDVAVRIDDTGISRKHARIRRTEGRYVFEDLGSTNGVFVNGRRVERIDLANGDRVQVGPSLVLRFALIAADEEALARRLYESSTRDGLTQLYNRKYASERLSAEVAYAARHGTLLAVIMLDIDHFKSVNDSFGHQAGDGVLRVVAAQTQKTIRAEDVLARYGGEEFLVLVRGIEHKNVVILADRMRLAVERLSIPWESRTLKITISLGVASAAECGPLPTPDALVALADSRLYRAKAGGRNRVVSAGSTPLAP
jgi:diguanylate cyclase (GGDEF)-like protein